MLRSTQQNPSGLMPSADFLVLENETTAAGDPVIAGVFCGGEEIREERTLADHG